MVTASYNLDLQILPCNANMLVLESSLLVGVVGRLKIFAQIKAAFVDGFEAAFLDVFAGVRVACAEFGTLC